MRVVVNGVFDLLHVGHVRLLREAKERFGWVLAAVDDDAFCRAQKREPVIPLAQRVELLRELRCVDEVCVVDWDWGPYCRDDDRTEKFFSSFQLDALLCGCDDESYVYRWFSYAASKGLVHTVPRTLEIDTTRIIQRIRDRR